MQWGRPWDGRGVAAAAGLSCDARGRTSRALLACALVLACGVVQLASQELSAEAVTQEPPEMGIQSTVAELSAPAVPQLSGVVLDQHASIIASSLECDSMEIRGTLSDSSLGLPEDLAVGAVVLATPLSCEGAATDIVVRSIASVEHVNGSATFTIHTYELLQDQCSPSGKVLLGDSGLQVCILQEQLPAVGMRTGPVLTGQYTHEVYLNIAAEDLQQLMLPGVGPEDVYIAYSKSSSKSGDPVCGLAKYEAPNYKISNTTGMILATAPFYICAKACPKNGSPLLVESACTGVGFEAPLENDEALEEEKKKEDSPFNFVKKDTDFYEEALIEEQLKEEQPSYYLSRSMIGLIVGCVVSTVVIVVVAFAVVRCANVSNRSMIAPYLRASRPPLGGAPQAVAYHSVSVPTTPARGTYPTSPFPGSTNQTPRIVNSPSSKTHLAVASHSPYASVTHSPYGYAANTPVASGTPKPTRPAAYSSFQAHESPRRSELTNVFASRGARAVSPALTPGKAPRGS